MDKKLKELERVLGKGRVRQNEPMSSHTTFKIGGSARFYVEVKSIEELVKAIKEVRRLKMPFFILGGGSNILVADQGVKGLVIKNNCRNFSVLQMKGRVKNQRINIEGVSLFAESGVIMNQLVRFTIEQGLSGLEYLLGLPGTVGGAVFMNSHYLKKQAFVGDCLSSAKILTKDGSVKEVDKSYFHFDYNRSVLQDNGEIALSVVFKLLPVDKKVLWKRGMEALEYRSATYPKGASAGCIFQNISNVEAISIPTPERITSAGYLIDKAGLKGKRVDNVMVSDKHANFILNMGNAKARDVLKLIDLIKEEVLKKFGVRLILEIRTVGF